MAVMRMVAMTLIGPHSEMEPVARHMVLTGGFQPLPIDMLVSDRSLRAKVNTATENPYDELLAKVATVWKVAGETLPVPSPVALSKDFSYDKAKMSVERAIGTLDLWAKRRAALIEDEELLKAAKLFVEALAGTPFSPKDLAGGEFVKAIFGRLSNENYQRLVESGDNSQIIINELTSVNGNTWVLLIILPRDEESVRKLLNAVYFTDYPVQEIANQLEGDDPVALLKKRLESHKRAIEGLAKAAKDMLREHRDKYKMLFSQLYTMQRVYDVCKGRGEISDLFILSGWIPEDTLHRIKPTIEEDAPTTVLLIEDTEDVERSGVRAPTLLKNNKMFRAFQDVVAMYSLPSYGEFDPSPLVGITFILFFGFMFGDIGHGIMIYLGTLFFVKRGLMRKSFGQVIKAASVSSVIFGALYGSVFGIEGLLPPLWMAPMHDPSRLLVAAICVGVFMISFGLVLNMIKQYREKNFGRMLFDGQGLAGLFLYWTVAALAAIYMMGKRISKLAMSIMLGGVVVMLLLMLFRDVLARYLLKQREGEESIVLNLSEILHNLLSFLSNTASFVRLAAFALNHVGLSMAVMMLSEMVHNLPGGIVMKGIILLIGNVVIVCLEGLIVFIQTLRLEYYEFFGKFYKGGGNAFKPVKWEKKAKEPRVT